MKTSPQRLSIIVPTLDEEAALDRCLSLALPHGNEVIVSDGGSRDRTLEIAESHGCKVVAGAPGRGGQLNRGAVAAAARGAEILVFLHADTTLPEGASGSIRRAIEKGAVGGAFLLQFEDPPRILRFGARLINLRTRLLKIPLGDQVQFATREAFEALGGFRDWPILEDLDFIRRLKRHGRLAILDPPVITAGRRFLENGAVRTVVTNWLIWILFACGAKPHRLARLYRHIR